MTKNKPKFPPPKWLNAEDVKMYDVDRIRKVMVILSKMGLRITEMEATSEWVDNARAMRQIVDDTGGQCGNTVQGFDAWLDKSKFGAYGKEYYKNIEGCLFGIKIKRKRGI